MKKQKVSDSPLDVWPPVETLDKDEERRRRIKNRQNKSYEDPHEKMFGEELNAPVFDAEEEKPVEDEQNRDERDEEREQEEEKK